MVSIRTSAPALTSRTGTTLMSSANAVKRKKIEWNGPTPVRARRLSAIAPPPFRQSCTHSSRTQRG